MSISNVYRSPSRLAGMNSGLDTGSIVSQLVKLEQMKIDRVYQNRTTSQWKVDGYNDINKELSDFRSKHLSALSPTNMFSPGAFKAYKANYKENNYFKVTATGSTIPGNYKISAGTTAKYASVLGRHGLVNAPEMSSSILANKLQTNVSSNGIKIASGDVTGSTQLKDVLGADGNAAFTFESGVASIQINGKEAITFNETDTVDQFVSKINAAKTTTNVEVELKNGQLDFKSGLGNKSGVVFKNGAGKIFSDDPSKGLGIKEGAQARKAFDRTASLEDIGNVLGEKLYDEGTGKMSFEINGKSFSFDKTDSFDTVMNAVNADTTANVTMFYDEAIGKFTFKNNTGGGSITVKNTKGKFFGADGLTGIAEGTSTKSSSILGSDSIEEVARKMNNGNITYDTDGKFKFEINGREFAYDKSVSISQVMADVNNSNVGVTMAYSEIQGGFTFTSKTMGRDSTVTLKNVGDATAFGENGLFKTDAGTVNGTSATITINGKTIEKDSNNFTIDGMNFVLTEDFNFPEEKDQFLVTFSQDIDSVVKNMKSFIEDYNKIVNKLYGLMTEKRDNKFKPLTEEERGAMSDKEIENWEAKAKKGVLRGDDTFRALLGDLRSGIWGAVEGSDGSPFTIGLTTASRTLSGELKLDEEVFRKALEEDSDRVANIMTRASYATDKASKFNESGFIARISNTIGDYSKESRNGVIKQQNDAIKNFDKKISDLTIKMFKQEERYWAKFTALEKAMSNMNAQKDWLTSQLGSLNG